MSIMGFVDTEDKERILHLNDIMTLCGRFNSKSEFIANVISHEHIHQLQKDDHYMSLSSALQDRTRVDAKLVEGSGKFLRYLAHEAELQARLHTVLANAYQQHGIMPTNKLELLVALKSQGVKVPLRANEELARSVAGAKALMRFSEDPEFVANNADRGSAKELSSVAENLEEGHLVNFWDKTLPRLYGDLLELYGDSHGSARMGLGHNIQLREIFYKEVDALTSDPQNAGLHLSRAYSAIVAMPDNQAQELQKLVMEGRTYRQIGHTVHIPREYEWDLISLFNMRKKGVPPQHPLYITEDLDETTATANAQTRANLLLNQLTAEAA